MSVWAKRVVVSADCEDGVSGTVVGNVEDVVVGLDVFSEDPDSRAKFWIELGGNARESSELEVGAGIASASTGRSIGLVRDDVLSAELGMRVNFSIDPGANPKESPEVDVGSGIASARTERSALIGFISS